MKKFIPIIVIAILFIVSSFLSQQYTNFVRDFIVQFKLAGMVVYVLATVIAVVAAPLSSIPLVPVLVSVWGVLLTSTLSVVGWTIGSIIAFWIARRFGAPVVRKFISLEKTAERYENITEKNLFWYLILLRMTVPVDILSYALGIFTKIGWKLYIITTFLGVIPVVVLLSFFGTIPAKYQVLLFLIGAALFSSLLLIKKNKKGTK